MAQSYRFQHGGSFGNGLTTILTAGIYDEAKGDPDNGLDPETRWANVPDG